MLVRTFVFALVVLLMRPALGDILETTSSSFHGQATFSQRERVTFQTRVLAEILGSSGVVTVYDQTFSSSPPSLAPDTNAPYLVVYESFTDTFVSDFQTHASGNSLSEFEASKSAAATLLGMNFPLHVIDGDPHAPDVSSAIALARHLLETMVPGATIDQTESSIVDITQVVQQTAGVGQDTVTVTFREDNGDQIINTHTHTEQTEAFLLTQGTLYQTTIRLSPAQVAAPEPPAVVIWSLLGLGLAGLAYYRAGRK